MIGIRVDGNSEIATGHFMRCLSIASEIKNMDMECIFITADETGMSFLASYGYKVFCLNSEWDSLEIETEQLIEVIHQYKIKKLIIDTYYVTFHYLEVLQTQTKVIYLDDLNLFRYPISMVINYNIYYELFSYEETYRDFDTQLLLGCSFAPLRDEFTGLAFSFRNKVKKVLITTGGTDRYNVAGKLIRKIVEGGLFQGIEFHIVVGIFNRNLEYLAKLSDNNASIILHKGVKEIAKLMSSCDSAITAGGSTMYELCACGTPTICFSFADNQLCGVEGFEKEGIMVYAGDVRYDEESCITSLIRNLNKYVNNNDARKEKSLQMRKKVDGKGVKRIVEAIIKL